MKVLVVDDDTEYVDLLAYGLGREGYTVLAASDGRQGLLRWETEQPHVVLLDVNLPKLDGLEVCRHIRRHATRSATPVIMLSACSDEHDIVQGLDAGADDYLPKPFSMRQLTAHIRAVVRRSHGQDHQVLARRAQAGSIELDLDTYETRVAGQMVALTRLQFRILHKLVANEGLVVPYGRLVEYAGGSCGESSAQQLRTHISLLRKRLGVPASGPGAIQNVPGVGYSLVRFASSTSSTSSTHTAPAA